jgi:hypothetical protein
MSNGAAADGDVIVDEEAVIMVVRGADDRTMLGENAVAMEMMAKRMKRDRIVR